MASSETVVMLGLPRSGRSTFLAALWHQMVSGEVATALTSARLPANREFLNKLRDAWLTCEEVKWNPAGLEPHALLHLRLTSTGREVDLSLSDVASDVLARQWIDRQIPAAYMEQVRRAIGLLLFVHGNQVIAPARIQLAARPASAPAQPSEWEPRFSSTPPTQIS